MPEDTAKSASPPEGASSTDRREDAVWWATWLGLILALVGLVDGVIMALKRKVAPCPDGKFFPEGTTDFSCYVHPQAGVGVAVAALSVLLGILVAFTSILVRTSLTRRP